MKITLIFSSESFIVLTFRLMRYFELIFTCGIRKGSELHLFACRYTVVLAPLIEMIISYIEFS